MAKSPRTQRKPGVLFRLTSQVPPDAPAWMRGLVSQLDTYLQKMWMAVDNSLPGLHGRTHLGGRDNIVSNQNPSPIVFGANADPGTPQSGVAAIDHVHSFTLGPGPDGNLIPQVVVEGNPSPPFRTLKQQTDWYNSLAARDYCMNVVKANTFR